MASRKDQRRTQFLVGAFVVGTGLLLLGSLFIISVSEGLTRSKVTLRSDFSGVAGLKEKAVVQLAGKEIGSVAGIEFVTREYPCDPLTEDIGLHRTDACPADLFCAATAEGGRCAQLEEYTKVPADYESCDGSCPQAGYECVTQPFRKRYRRVRWAGRAGWCVPYRVDHQRVEVTMEIYEEALQYIRDDSRATITSAGVLGDQLINVTAGRGTPIEDGGSIQSNLSLFEELMGFKDRLDSIVDNVDRSLAGLAEFGDALSTDDAKRSVQGIMANVDKITRQIADAEGVVGGLISDPEYKEDFAQTLESVKRTAKSLDNTLAQVDRQIDPALRSLRTAATSLGELSDLAKDPNNPALVSRLLNDPKLAEDVSKTIADASEAIASTKKALEEVQLLVADVSHSISAGEGTLGKLIKDPKAYDDLVKALGNIERNNVVKRFIRYLYEQEEAADSARPSRGQTADR